MAEDRRLVGAEAPRGLVSLFELLAKVYVDRGYRGLPSCSTDALRRHLDAKKTGFVTLNCLLAPFHANKPELLMALELPHQAGAKT
jgi:hypothetical protein